MPVLDIQNLSVTYRSGRGHIHAVDNVSFSLEKGETLGLVGESGCGKTTIGKAILRLHPEGAISPKSRILFEGQDLLALSDTEMRAVRGSRIGLIPQSAMNALDPVSRIGDLIKESLAAHGLDSPESRDRRLSELFASVGLDTDRIGDYPHMFSGGMRQRAIIAMAFSLNPSLIIADEPTTGLDVIVQEQVLKQLSNLIQKEVATFLIITHDIGIVAEHCRTTAVMYAGRLVEIGPTREVLLDPFHPYTMGLQNGFLGVKGKFKEVISIPGAPPSLTAPSPGCPFYPRCPFAESRCETEVPPLEDVSPAHRVACHFHHEAHKMRELTQRAETWREAAL